MKEFMTADLQIEQAISQYVTLTITIADSQLAEVYTDNKGKFKVGQNHESGFHIVLRDGEFAFNPSSSSNHNSDHGHANQQLGRIFQRRDQGSPPMRHSGLG